MTNDHYKTHIDVWRKHLIPGKLYREICPDVRGWNEVEQPPMMFVGFKIKATVGRPILRFLDMAGRIQLYALRSAWTPKDWWERIEL